MLYRIHSDNLEIEHSLLNPKLACLVLFKLLGTLHQVFIDEGKRKACVMHCGPPASPSEHAGVSRPSEGHSSLYLPSGLRNMPCTLRGICQLLQSPPPETSKEKMSKVQFRQD